MPVSLFQAELEATPIEAGIRRCEPIDKSKFSLFKPLSLDVIFHDCKTEARIQRKLRCFCAIMSMKACELIS